MDWYSWLSKTSLELSLVYEYGLAFTRNELQEEDIGYFNHEFLQSMGISVAKHRLEIVKLARKEAGGRSNGFSKLVSAINKTRKLLAKNITKWSLHKHSSPMPLSELTPCRTRWTGPLRRINGPKEHNYDTAMVASRCTMRSGPIHRREQENLMVNSKSLSISGPLDGKEKLPFACRSTTASGPLGFSPKVYHCNDESVGAYDEIHSVWSLMFQDMKPN